MRTLIECVFYVIHYVVSWIEFMVQLLIYNPFLSNDDAVPLDEFLKATNHVFHTMLPLHNSNKNNNNNNIIKVESLQISSFTSNLLLPSHSSSIKNQLKHLFIMITGNPGVCHIYDPFCQQLNQTLKTYYNESEYAILAVSFTAHSLSHTINQYYQQPDQQETFTIEEQIEHKKQLLLHLIKLYPNTKIHLMGHSVGSYVICKVIQSMPDEEFVNKHFGLFFMLFPTIQNMISTPNAQTYQYLFGYYTRRVISKIVPALFNSVPLFLRKVFIKTYSNKQENAGSTILQECGHLFLQYPLLLNVTTLATTEFQDIQSIENVLGAHLPLTKSLFTKCRWITCDNDGWCPREHIQTIEAYLENYNQRREQLWKDEEEKELFIVNRSDCHHAFCIHKSDNSVISEFVLENCKQLRNS
jgi:pimeloyl-ACP methyl ester carboxylesterase